MICCLYAEYRCGRGGGVLEMALFHLGSFWVELGWVEIEGMEGRDGIVLSFWRVRVRLRGGSGFERV